MICYMPFTSLENDQKQVLYNLLGTITVLVPAEGLLGPQMRSWGESGALDIRYPASVKGAQLIAALEEYKAWAELHQGSIGEMAGFFKTAQGRTPMMDETNPSQIGYQIRHYGESRSHGVDELLFKACLFLSMAQEHDIQQLGMVRELDEVNAMEQSMLRQLSGNADEPDLDVRGSQNPAPSSDRLTQDPYMISQRVRAWSRLALDCEAFPLMFVTLSKDVVASVLDMFTDADSILEQSISVNTGHPNPTPSSLRKHIEDAATHQDFKSFDPASSEGLASDEKGERFTLYKLVGISPDCFLTRLAAYGDEKEQPHRSDDASRYTLIGWITPYKSGNPAVET